MSQWAPSSPVKVENPPTHHHHRHPALTCLPLPLPPPSRPPGPLSPVSPLKSSETTTQKGNITHIIGKGHITQSNTQNLTAGMTCDVWRSDADPRPPPRLAGRSARPSGGARPRPKAGEGEGDDRTTEVSKRSPPDAPFTGFGSRTKPSAFEGDPPLHMRVQERLGQCFDHRI